MTLPATYDSWLARPYDHDDEDDRDPHEAAEDARLDAADRQLDRIKDDGW